MRSMDPVPAIPDLKCYTTCEGIKGSPMGYPWGLKRDRKYDGDIMMTIIPEKG